MDANGQKCSLCEISMQRAFSLFLNGIEPNWITLLKIKFYFMVFSIFNQNIFSVHQKWRFEQPIPHIFFDPQLSSGWGTADPTISGFGKLNQITIIGTK